MVIGMLHIFKRITDLRIDNDLTQKEIAEEIGVSRQIYSLWEIEVKIIPLKHLNSLSNYYGVSMDYLLNLSNNKATSKTDNLDKVEIGKRIKEVRLENNLTLRALASKLNTTGSNIYAYEIGKTLILTAFAYELCKNLNISLDWLCGKSNKKYIKDRK